jgi:ABC-type nitrate/sulfonate/bicarbonate transport system substrate-binding protein
MEIILNEMSGGERDMFNHRLAKVAASGLLLLAVLAGCSTTDAGPASPSSSAAPAAAGGDQPLPKVRYAAFNGISGLAVKFGAEKNFFKEEGLDVEFITTQDPIAGLVSKDIDVADIATTSAIVAAGKGAPIKIVSSMFRTKGPFYLLARPEIKTVEDLKGKKVGGAAFGSGLDVYTQVILSKHGLSKKDVTYIANGVNDAAYASLTTGQVDATIIHEPFVSLAEQEGTGVLLAQGWEYLPDFHTGVLAANDTVIADNPEVIEKLLRAYFRSQAYAKEHLDEYKTFLLAQMKVDKAALDKAFEREAVLWENIPDVNKEALQKTQELQVELGFQDKVYNTDDILDLRFIPQK